jgi:hypothetical protein
MHVGLRGERTPGEGADDGRNVISHRAEAGVLSMNGTNFLNAHLRQD